MLKSMEKLPALKALAAFLIGFAVYSALRPSMEIIAAVAAITLATAVLYYASAGAGSIEFKPAKTGLTPAALYVAISFCCALAIYGSGASRRIDIPLERFPEMPALAKGRVVKVLSCTSGKTRLALEGSLDAKPLSKLRDQGVLVNIYGAKKIEVGDELLVSGKARFPKRAALTGEFDEAAWLRALDVSWVMRAKSTDIAITGKRRGVIYYSKLASEAIQSQINTLYEQKNSGLISALLTGARTGLPADAQREFSLTGVAHILSVSGLHVGVFAAAIAALLGFVTLRWAKFAIFAALVAAFVAVTGFQPPAVRAGGGAILFYYCSVRELRAHPLNVISFALLAYLFISPQLIYSASFQMSSSAAFGITLLYKPFLGLFSRAFKARNAAWAFFAQSFAISFAAGAAVSPIVAYYFNVFSIVSPLANLSAAPLSSLALIYGMLSVAFSYFAPWAAACFAAVASFSVDVLIYFNKLALELPMAYIEGSAAFPAALGASLAMVYVAFSRSARHFAFRAVVSVAAIVLAWGLINKGAERKIEIFPRDQYVAVIVPDTANRKIALIVDRKPHTYPIRDLAMENYLINDKDFLILAFDGNAGINICDAVKKSKAVREEKLSFAALRFLKNRLDLREQLPQLTNVDK